MQFIEACPLCNHLNPGSFLTCEDSMYSHELFELKKCQSCSFVFTSPRPDDAQLPNYYRSDLYISHTGKSAGVLDRIYLLIRKFTLQWKINLVKSYKTKPHILDYGCGTGEFLHQCQRNNWAIAGFDPSPEASQKANKLTGIKIADNLQQLTGQKFDVITLWHVLEHVPDLKNTVARLQSLLSHDGLIIIAVPNHESPDASYYKQYWAAYDVPRHLWHFTKLTMESLLHSAGLHIRKITPMKLDAYYVSLLSEKYIASNRMSPTVIIKGALRGFISNQQARSSTNHSSLIYLVTK